MSETQYQIALPDNGIRFGVEFLHKYPPYLVKKVLEDGFAHSTDISTGDCLRAVFAASLTGEMGGIWNET